jgi:endonuclease/exonuclease/phosphatase (EEP) superfamily protein YafD
MSGDTPGPNHPSGDPPAQRSSRWSRARAIIAWGLVLSAGAILLLGWLIPIERTESRSLQFVVWVAFMVRTFTFHAGFAIACVAIYAAAFRLWRPLLACVPLLGITLGPAAFSYLPKSPPPIAGPSLRVLSCNLLVGSGSTDRAADYIRGQDPDIVFFQEYTPAAHDLLARTLKDSYPHIVSSLRDDAFGQAIYSKLPLTEVKLFPPPVSGARPENRRIGSPTEPQIRCVVTLNGREIVLQNVHDMPPAGLSLLQDQLRYFEWLRDFTGAERRPMILAGDFNSTMNSTPTCQLLRDGFQNTHDLAGRGRGSTWVDVTWLRHLPGVRIDHIFVSQELTCDLSEVGPSTGSDHRPIIARIGFKSGVR